jgi:carbamate kinase
MGPKVLGACQFVRETGHESAIGQLSDLALIMNGEAGTLISNAITGIQYGE